MLTSTSGVRSVTLLFLLCLISASQGQTNRLDEASPVVTIKPGFPILAPVFTADNRWLASDVEPLGIKVWDVQTGAEVLHVTQQVNHFALSANGQHLACLTPQGIKLWDTRRGKNFLLVKLPAASPGFTPLAFSPDGKRLAAVFPRGVNNPAAVRIWEADTGREVSHLEGETGGVGALAFSPDGKRLATSFGSRVKVWDPASAEVVANAEFPSVGSLSFSPDGKRLAVVSQATVEILDTGTGKAELFFKARDPITSLAYAPDGKRLVCCFHQGLAAHDAFTGEELVRHSSAESFGVSPAAFSPDGKLLARASPKQGTVHVWEAATGHEILTSKGHGRPQSVRFVGSDGKLLVSLGYSEAPGRLPEFVVAVSQIAK